MDTDTPVTAVDDVTLLLAAGAPNRGDGGWGCESERYTDADELESELDAVHPVEQWGSPGRRRGTCEAAGDPRV